MIERQEDEETKGKETRRGIKRRRRKKRGGEIRERQKEKRR